MRSRTVQPVKRRGQSKDKRGKKTLGDTQPLRAVSYTQSVRRASTDTQPMRHATSYKQSLGSVGRQTVSRRMREVSVPKPEVHREKRVKKKQSSLAGTVFRRKIKDTNAVQYFDYDLLLAIVFLMCFGLVMLYSTSAYSAQADFGNDMYYFSKQAFIGVVSFVWMLFVSRID